MESVFYKYGYKKRFPVTYLFLELFSKSIENSEQGADVRTVLEPVLSALGLKPPYQEDFMTDILMDIEEVQNARAEKAGSSKPAGKGKRTFGTEFIKWFAKLEQEQVLLLLTDYDFDAAYKLYSEVPVLLVDRMIETKMGYEWTQAESNFEAVIFGMGGSIKGGSDDGKAFEAPETKTDEVQRDNQLKKLGFM